MHRLAIEILCIFNGHVYVVSQQNCLLFYCEGWGYTKTKTDHLLFGKNKIFKKWIVSKCTLNLTDLATVG